MRAILALALFLGMTLQIHAMETNISVGPIDGALLVPDGAQRPPVALLIAGSGPTDRNGDGPSATPATLQKLATALAAHGIASLRYDKRGVGKWKPAYGAPEDFRFGHFVDDAVSLVAALRKRDQFSSIIIIGHSEGALVGTLAAGRAKVDGLVLLTATSRRQGDVLKEQLQRQVPADVLKPIADAIDRIMEDQVVEPLPAGLHIPPAMQPAFASAFREEPLPPLTALQLPVLIVSGGKDKQVGRLDFDRLGAAAHNARTVWLDTMNHVLVDVSDDADNIKAYTDPQRPLNSNLIDEIASFIKRRQR